MARKIYWKILESNMKRRVHSNSSPLYAVLFEDRGHAVNCRSQPENERLYIVLKH